MAKHNIEMKVVKIESEEIVQNIISEISIGLLWKNQLAEVISKNFRCEIRYMCRGKSKKVIFIGYVNDTEIATSIFKYAYKVINRNANKLLIKNKKEISL